MRRRHLSEADIAEGKLKAPVTKIEGTEIDDPLDPSFTHEPMEHKEGKPDEFGIGLDYWSDIGKIFSEMLRAMVLTCLNH